MVDAPRPDRRGVPVWATGALLALVTVLPILTTGWFHDRAGWYPESDDATIVLLAHDSLSRHPPLVGMPSTGGAALDDPELHHPGPLAFQVLAPFARLGGGSVRGITVAAVLVNLAAVITVALALRSVGGNGLAAAGLVAAALALWGIGGDVPASVWNPFIVALPFAALVALAVATVAGRRGLLPATLAVGSFVMQTHLSYLGMVGLLLVWVLTATGLDVWRTRHDAPRWAADRRSLAASAAVVLVLWAAPIIQQVTGQPGNLAQILRSATGPGGATAGSAALGELGRVIGPPVLGLAPRPDLVRVLPPVDLASVLLLALPWLVGLALAVVAHRRGRPEVVRVLATLAVVLAGSAITASRIPLSDGVLYQYYALWMRPVAAITWLLLGWAAVTLGHRPGWAPGRRARTAATLTVTAALVAVAALPRPGAWEPWAAYRRVAGALLPETVDALPRAGRYLVRFRGGTPYLSTGSAVVAGLELAGSTALVDPGVPTPVFPWREQRRYRDQEVDGELWVVSGRPPPDLPAGARLVASTPTLTPSERARQQDVAADLEATLRQDGLEPGPRAPGSAAERAAVAAARRHPVGAVRTGAVAQLAAQGLVRPPGGDLHRVVTDARMRALADEGEVRVYLVTRGSAPSS